MAEHALTWDDAKLLINSISLPHEQFKTVFKEIAKRNRLWECTDKQIEQIHELLCQGLIELIVCTMDTVDQQN